MNVTHSTHDLHNTSVIVIDRQAGHAHDGGDIPSRHLWVTSTGGSYPSGEASYSAPAAVAVEGGPRLVIGASELGKDHGDLVLEGQLRPGQHCTRCTLSASGPKLTVLRCDATRPVGPDYAQVRGCTLRPVATQALPPSGTHPPWGCPLAHRVRPPGVPTRYVRWHAPGEHRPTVVREWWIVGV